MALQFAWDATAEIENPVFDEGEWARNGLRHGLRLLAVVKSWSETNELSNEVVPAAGLEPARPCGLEILSLLCLPFHHAGLERGQYPFGGGCKAVSELLFGGFENRQQVAFAEPGVHGERLAQGEHRLGLAFERRQGQRAPRDRRHVARRQGNGPVEIGQRGREILAQEMDE